MKKGDTIIVKEDHYNELKKGEIFTIDSFSCCPNCGQQTLFLKEISKYRNTAPITTCNICKLDYDQGRANYRPTLFEKVEVVVKKYKLVFSIEEDND